MSTDAIHISSSERVLMMPVYLRCVNGNKNDTTSSTELCHRLARQPGDNNRGAAGGVWLADALEDKQCQMVFRFISLERYSINSIGGEGGCGGWVELEEELEEEEEELEEEEGGGGESRGGGGGGPDDDDDDDRINRSRALTSRYEDIYIYIYIYIYMYLYMN